MIDFKKMRKIFNLPTEKFAELGMEKHHTLNRDIYYTRTYPRNKVLAVAHLDSVQKPEHFKQVRLRNRDLLFSPVLDDRLGAYIILDLLPKMGLNVDILLTNSEERGQTTAQYFTTEKEYNWMVEFDRKGDDVVCYGYETPATKKLLQSYGFKVGNGIFSDISELDHLHCFGFNIGVGYENYHSLYAYADIGIMLANLHRFQKFYKENFNTRIPHTPAKTYARVYTLGDGTAYGSGYGSDGTYYGREGFNPSIYMIDCKVCRKRVWRYDVKYHPDELIAYEKGYCIACYEELQAELEDEAEKKRTEIQCIVCGHPVSSAGLNERAKLAFDNDCCLNCFEESFKPKESKEGHESTEKKEAGANRPAGEPVN